MSITSTFTSTVTVSACISGSAFLSHCLLHTFLSSSLGKIALLNREAGCQGIGLIHGLFHGLLSQDCNTADHEGRLECLDC